MSFFSDPSALVLIVGAIAIVAFVVHGLWFSGKPENRKLNQADRRDDEIRNSSEIGKVRIVSTDVPLKSAATATANPQAASEVPLPQSPVIEEITQEAAAQLEREQEQKKLPQTIEINLVAPAQNPYRGEDIEALCAQYGILRGEHDIYYVYENPQERVNEVFRICSLKTPFYFPQEMAGFTTPAIAMYMNLPERGKASSYFKAMLTAVDIFTSTLGGSMEDNYHRPYTQEMFQDLENKLQEYDAKA